MRVHLYFRGDLNRPGVPYLDSTGLSRETSVGDGVLTCTRGRGELVLSRHQSSYPTPGGPGSRREGGRRESTQR